MIVTCFFSASSCFLSAGYIRYISYSGYRGHTCFLSAFAILPSCVIRSPRSSSASVSSLVGSSGVSSSSFFSSFACAR